MTKSVSPPALETLLAHAGWLRRLAVHLVRDPDAADDLVQETWLAAVRQPPREQGTPRGWLGVVATNFARMKRRTAGRRAAASLEVETHTRPEVSPESVVERAELIRMVSELVMELREPYRSTLLLHFLENRTSAEIADIYGIKTGTVRFRIMYGLDLLRQGLDRRHEGDRRRWLAALVPVAGSEPAPPTGASGKGKALLQRWLVPLVGVAALTGVVVALGAAFSTRRAGVDVAAGEEAMRKVSQGLGRRGDKTNPAPLSLSPFASSAGRGPSGHWDAEGESILAFDFEDGLTPALFEQGHVVPAPPGASSRYCAVGTVNVSWPGNYGFVVDTKALEISYSRAAVLAFDFLVEDDRYNIAVTVRNASKNLNYDFYVHGYAVGSWNHVALPLSSFVRLPQRTVHLEESDLVSRISVYGGRTGGQPFFIDNLRLVLVPPDRQQDPGPPIPLDEPLEP